MIKISSFSPIQNFSRWVWEFYDDKIIVKTKSLNFDYEREIRYEKIQSIRNKRTADLEWLWISLIIIGLVGLATAGFNYLGVASPIIGVAEKVAVALALALSILVFRKQEYYWFIDADKNLLATVRVTEKDKQTLLEAIQLIKQKNETISETYFDDHIPTTPPVFQFTEFDFADFLNKSTVSFYNDRIIDIEKSLVEEVTLVIKYDELNGKTAFAKIGNERWDSIWLCWLYFVGMTTMFLAVFFAKQVNSSDLYLNLVYGGLALLIPLFFLKYIKSEVVVFYDKKDNGVFWTKVNVASREKLNQIIGYIQEKVALQK